MLTTRFFCSTLLELAAPVTACLRSDSRLLRTFDDLREMLRLCPCPCACPVGLLLPMLLALVGVLGIGVLGMVPTGGSVCGLATLNVEVDAMDW